VSRRLPLSGRKALPSDNSDRLRPFPPCAENREGKGSNEKVPILRRRDPGRGYPLPVLRFDSSPTVRTSIKDLPAEIEVVRTGNRYVVGVHDEAYALWDLSSPESPIERFSGDEAGLDAALIEFDDLERMVRGPLRWLLPVRIVFLVSIITWAVFRGVETTWLYLLNRTSFTGVPISLVAVQAVTDIAFVAWVSSLATIASFWLADSLRMRVWGR
jgi:hypothetical protein